MSERTCSKCGQSKPETLEFFRSRGTKDRGGLRPDCRDCNKVRDKAYYQANQDRFRSYRAANAEQIAAYQAQYMATYVRPAIDPEKYRARIERWKAAGGRAIYARASQRRRARKAGLPSAFTAEDWSACLEWFGNRCAYCGKSSALTQDHVIPVSAGGGYVPDNIISACGSCNFRKNATPMEKWFRKQQFFDEERLMLIVFYTQMAQAG